MLAKNTLLFFWEILKVVVLALVIVLPIRYFIFQPFVVRGESMEPNFHNGDYLIIDEISYRFKDPQRGEVVVFRYPGNPSDKFIKRIIALPEEEVEFKDNQIVITDEFDQKTILNESDYLQVDVNFTTDQRIILGEDEYLVLGDNRLHSFDSRNWGSLPRENIIGRVILRIFPPRAMASFLAPQY